MFTPSLTLVLCILAPAVALWQTLRKPAPHMPYLVATVPLMLAAALGVIAELEVLGWDIPEWICANFLIGQSTLFFWLSYHVPLATSVMLISCATLVWLQHRKSLLFYPTFTRSLAAPISLAAAAVVPLFFATPYLFGIIKWQFASPLVKTSGIVGVFCLSLAALALLALIAQLLFSLLKAFRGHRSAP